MGRKKKIDFRALKRHLPEYLADVTDKKDRKWICPLCFSGTGASGTPAFSIIPNTDQTQWKCHACDKGGDIVDLYCLLNNCDNVTAAESLAASYEPDAISYWDPVEEFRKPSSSSRATKQEKQPAADEEELHPASEAVDGESVGAETAPELPFEDNATAESDFQYSKSYELDETGKFVDPVTGQPVTHISGVDPGADRQAAPVAEKSPEEEEEPEVDCSDFIREAETHILECDYLARRGISLEVQQRFHVGFIARWRHPKAPQIAPLTPRMIIPTSPYSYLARAVDPNTDKKYAKQKVGKIHFLNIEALKERFCFVVEGEIDCLSVIQCGYPCIALGSTSMLRKLLEYCEKTHPRCTLIFAVDNDKAGRKAILNYLPKFQKSGFHAVKYNICGDFKDPNELLVANPEQLQVNLETAVKFAQSEADIVSSYRRPYDLSHAGNAELLSYIYRDTVRYCNSLGWLSWNGQKWETSESDVLAKTIKMTGMLLRDAQENAEKNIVEIDMLTGKKKYKEGAKQLLDHAKKSRSGGYIKHTMELSRAYLTIPADKLDADPYVLNTSGGLVDLRTGEIRPHDPDAFCTHIAPFIPSSKGAEEWEDFLRLITEDDAEMEGYLQQFAGMCAIGEVLHEGIVIAIGGGRNGKSTFFNALSSVLGDYATFIDSAVLTTDQQQNKEVVYATLRGRRLATCGELEEGQRLSTKTLKSLASTDNLMIKALYKDPESIRPSHHVCLFSNFLPRVSSSDLGTWRRISIIPFNATMPTGNKEVLNYSARLVENCGGAILKWIIDGAVMFIQRNCKVLVPDKVSIATREYRNREDWLSGFLSECCIKKPGAETRTGQLYEVYKVHAATNREYIRRANEFNSAMFEAGFEQQARGGNRKFWIDIEIRRDTPDL